jgi:hypothetical protein
VGLWGETDMVEPETPEWKEGSEGLKLRNDMSGDQEEEWV